MQRTSLLLALTLGALVSSASAAKLTIWTQYEGPELAWLKYQASKYASESGKDVSVVSVKNDDLRTRLLAEGPKGKGPDLIVSQPHDRIGEFAAAGVIAPVDQFVLAKADLSEVALEAMTYQGKLYGLPMSAEAVAVVYNKKLVKSVPTNWDAFMGTAKRLTKNGSYGFAYDVANAYMGYGLVSAYGGYIFKSKAGTLDVRDLGIGNAGAIQAARLINDLRFKHGLVPSSLKPDVMKKAFLDGKLAMYLTGPWDMGDIKKAGIDYGIAAMPTPPGAKNPWKPFVGVQGVLLSAYSKDKAGAVQLAWKLVWGDAQVQFNKAGGRIPVSKFALARLKDDAVVSGFGASITRGVPMPNVREMGAVWGPWTTAFTYSTAKANPNFGAIFAKAVTDVKKNIK